MTTFTTQAIEAAFIDLLGEKPFDKITVMDIVKRCGINRNTFYYHYHDIYDLLDQLLAEERALLLAVAREDFSTWPVAIKLGTAFASKNKKQIYNLYNSVNQTRIEHFLFDALNISMRNFILVQAADLDVNEEVLDIVVRAYTLTLEGFVIEWLEQGMQGDLLDALSQIEYMFAGATRNALERGIKSHSAQ